MMRVYCYFNNVGGFYTAPFLNNVEPEQFKKDFFMGIFGVKMKVSVLISVYYKEKPQNLKEALESIIKQTVMPNQIVIIKDGKLTSELEKVLEIYKKKYKDLIEIYGLDRNVGLGQALKYGIEKCKYEYIARQDSDDISVKERFQKQISYLQENQDIDILGGYIEEYDENMKKLLSVRKVPLSSEGIKKYIKKQCPFNHGTVIMKKKAVIDAGNYNSVILEDYDLWARMVKCNAKMENISVVLGKNRTGKTLYKKHGGKSRIKSIIEILI